jgi:hypothetical protein
MQNQLNIPLNQIKVDPTLQMRAGGLDREYVAELAQIRKEGGEFRDPAVLFKPAKGKYLLAGGFHRYEAEKLCGHPSIRAVVLEGEYRDAWLFALGDNYAHGKRRTREDIRKAATAALTDPELSEMSAAEVAKIVKCDRSWMARLKREIMGAKPDPKKQRPKPVVDFGDEPSGTDDDADGPEPSNTGKEKPVATDGGERFDIRDELNRVVPEPIADAYAADRSAHMVCPLYDDLAEDIHERGCRTCGGKGYLTSDEFRALPQVVKDQSLALEDPVDRALRFGDEFDKAVKMCRQLAWLVDRLATSPAGYFTRNCHDKDGTPFLLPVSMRSGGERYSYPPLLRLLKILASAKPKCKCAAKPSKTVSHVDCPYCAGQGWSPVAGGLIGTRPENLQLELLDIDPWDIEE